jgi:lipopolysaccharide/colanic/teichoic acid biosynthesis glycosyltransferase
MSLVGPPAGAADSMSKELFLGKPGVTGLVQLQQGRGLTEDEQQQLVIRYARSQSFLLDIEILLKFAVEHARG